MTNLGGGSGGLTVHRVPEAIAALEFVNSELPSVGINAYERTRLHQHLRLLRTVVGATSYPDDPTLRPAIANAMGDAAQFSQIASVIPRQQVASFVRDLKHALNGSQTRSPAESAEPYRFQSQLVFGAMLAAAGHDLAVRDGEGLPDFFARNGTMLHGIEIKRPKGKSGISSGVAKAAVQIAAAGGLGMVVIDVSDILQTSFARIVEPTGGTDLWREQFQEAFRALTADIDCVIREPGSTAPRRPYESVVAYCAFGNGWVWRTSDADPVGWPEFRAMCYARRLYRVHDLAFHRGTWLRDAVESALEHSSGSVELTRCD
jgi:hypothetical protein